MTNTLLGELATRFRVTIVAGVLYGALVVGVGSRLAMLALRLTSPDTVIGRTSDDGFTIGRFTLSGSYALVILGASVGLISVTAYFALRSWLIGPPWFKRVTIALASGAVGGALLVHADGIDFTLLEPQWFAVGLFIALPALFGAFIGDAVDLAERRDPSWRCAVLVLAPVFPAALVLPFLAALVATTHLMGIAIAQVRDRLAVGLIARATWLSIALWGLVALIGDLRAL